MKRRIKMVNVIKGDVVVVKFPFTDFTNFKRRPVLVVATLKGDDVIICQITSKSRNDPYAIMIEDDNINGGSLHGVSYARPGRLATIDKNIRSSHQTDKYITT
jgi:mRNA interferase MazF